MAFHSDLRIGDAERDAAIEMLNQHFAAGRLTQREHDERTSLALAARTRADLDALVADLPNLREDRPRRRHRTRRPLGLLVAAFVALAILGGLHVVPAVAAVVLGFFVVRRAFGWRGGCWSRRVSTPYH
jgi:hypothetical protein